MKLSQDEFEDALDVASDYLQGSVGDYLQGSVGDAELLASPFDDLEARDDHRRDGAFVVVKDLVVDARSRRKPSPTANSYRWDEVGNYVVSTLRLPAPMAEAVGALYETLVYSCVEGAWDFDGSGVQSDTEAEAEIAHAEACDRMRGRIQ